MAKTIIGGTFVLALTLLAAGAPAVFGQSAPTSKSYLVVGRSLVQQAGVNAARESAIADCKQSAVEQMTAELLPLEVLVQQFPAIDAAIYAQADDFIQYYKVLNENRLGSLLHVLVQAKVSGPTIEAKLRAAGILTADARPLNRLSLRVLGTDSLSSFVLFRGRLNQMAGVEDIQISEILPNQSTLAVDYRGTGNTFAETLLRQPQEGYRFRVFQESEAVFRIDLVPAPPAQPQG